MYVLQDTRVEEVQKGSNKYEILHVTYTDGNYNNTKKIVSFSNPAVYKALKDMSPGSQFSVSETQNGKFKNWSQIFLNGTESVKSVPTNRNTAGPQAAPSNSNVSTQVRSTYETPEERAQRQVYIIRQSSLERAVETLTPGSKAPLDPSAVIALASVYTDYVLGTRPQETQQAGPTE